MVMPIQKNFKPLAPDLHTFNQFKPSKEIIHSRNRQFKSSLSHLPPVKISKKHPQQQKFEPFPTLPSATVRRYLSPSHLSLVNSHSKLSSRSPSTDEDRVAKNESQIKMMSKTRENFTISSHIIKNDVPISSF